MKELTLEVGRVRALDPPPRMVESDVPASVKRGGPTSIPYGDLISEIRWEMKFVRSSIKLTQIDKELHSIYVRVLFEGWKLDVAVLS